MVHLWGSLSNLDLTELLSNPTSGSRAPRRQSAIVLWHPNTRLQPNQIAELLADYQAGTHLRELATKYAVSESTVKRHIRASGVEHRKTRALARDQIQEAARLYVHDGWSILKLSKHLHCAEDTVRKALRNEGVELRRRGRPGSGR